MNVRKVYQKAVDAYGDVRTLVRGLPYQCPDDWEEVLNSLDEDSNLYLVKEPDNPKDKLAIVAYLDDRRIGYVAASDNEKIWLYLTDDKMPCTFLESFDASFKVSFENPKNEFEGMPFEEIYKDKDGVTEKPYPAFEIPFLTDPKDKNYNWFDDQTCLKDLEEFIPDFRRKLATRFIILVGRKNSKGEYCYYLPYANNYVAKIYDDTIKDLIDEHGFVVALPDIPMKLEDGDIFMDLHVTFLTNTDFKSFDIAHQSEVVFNLTKDHDVNSTKAANQYSGESDRNYNTTHNFMKEESDGFMQDSFLTPSYSKLDYVLKKNEVKDLTIDKKTFNKINKTTSDLYTFVRKKLFPSMKLYSYLKEHTPYREHFYNLGQYETLLRVFVIKDLGRLYKGFNHSVNFDTAQGKALFLYMGKEVGQDTDVSYDVFKLLCDKRIDFESVVKMRELIENTLQSFYECDIYLWSDTDFIIHSFLKNVDKVLAKSYMKLLRQFASVVVDKDELSLYSLVNSSKGSAPAICDFFPLFGFTLGETTLEQAESMGYEIKNWKDDPEKYTDVEGISFNYDDVEGVFTSLYWNREDCDFPPLWKSKGFSWNLSYDAWLAVFKKIGYKTTIKKGPSQREFNGRQVFCAQVEISSPDNTLKFDLEFDYGEDGSSSSSSNILDCITVTYDVAVADESQSLYKEKSGISTRVCSSSFDDFFPLFGITLGQTTWKQVEEMKYEVNISKEGPGRYAYVKDVGFYDDEGGGVFTSIWWNRRDANFPPSWRSKGFSWKLSYDEWVSLFRNMGFKITVTKDPSQTSRNGQEYLIAKYEALSPDGKLLFELDFDYGKNGCFTSSPGTLNDIWITFNE